MSKYFQQKENISIVHEILFHVLKKKQNKIFTNRPSDHFELFTLIYKFFL